jgi:TPR repeat protein
LRRNEKLGVGYLARLCGVDVGAIRRPGILGDVGARSVLPCDVELSSDGRNGTSIEGNDDEAALLALASCCLSGMGLDRPDPDCTVHCLT